MVGPFVFGVCSFTAIQAGFTLISLAQRPMLSGQLVLRLTVLQIPQYLALAFPMGMLLGTLFALGQLSSHSEIVAMRAGGLSGLRLMAPFAVAGFLASLGSLYLSEVVVPITHVAYRREQARSQGQETGGALRHQALPPELERDGKLKRLIYVGEFDLANLRLHEVRIHEYTAGQERTSVQADDMVWDGAAWRFQQGEVKFFQPDGSMSRLIVRGGRADYQPLLPKPKEISLVAAEPADMTWREFRRFIDRRILAGEDVRRFLVELYTRLSLPFACFALALVGAPLGVQTRRAGTAMSFGLAIVVLISYFFMLSFAQVLGRSGVLPPMVAAWLANIILFGAAAFLYSKRLQ